MINDPLGQTHSLASSDHYFHLKFVLFCDTLKSRDERTDMCENVCNHVKPSVTVGRLSGSVNWKIKESGHACGKHR